MSVVVGRAENVDRLADLWVESWQEAIGAIDFSARRSWIVARLHAWPAGGLLTAAVDGTAMGFLLLDQVQGLIDQLAVASAVKGRGVAAALLATARALAPDGLVLDVNADNTRAIRFYMREGFQIVAAGVSATSALPTWRMRTAPATR